MLTGYLDAIPRHVRDYRYQIKLIDDETGGLMDTTGSTFEVHLYGRDRCCCHPRTLDTAIVSPGILEWSTDLTGVPAGYYDLEGDVTRNGVTAPLFRFTLSIMGSDRCG